MSSDSGTSWIEIINKKEARGRLQELYQRVAGPGGAVDNVLQIHSLRPHTLEAHMALYKSVLHHSGNKQPKWLLETIGVYVSLLNGCTGFRQTVAERQSPATNSSCVGDRCF